METYPVNYPEMVVQKSIGLTPSEQKLNALGYQTFLRLWSYPNPYKMQLNGKELCDLLIVFDNHVIIFSDKNCVYGDSGDPYVDWRRWYKRTIQKSAEQLVGAKSWIIRHPDRIAIDAKCTKALPLKVEITSRTKFHLVAVAHGASNHCKAYFPGGDGGLHINSEIIGKMHTDDNCELFCIGKVLDNPQNFIHVFDDASYENVLRELDTIQDFLNYLESRKELLLTKSVLAESENDILGHHMTGVIKNEPHLLQKTCHGYSGVHFESGLLENIRRSVQYHDWRNTMKKSYFWDALLQNTFYYIENGLSYLSTTPTIQANSELFRRMAREDRAHRYCLADEFLSFLSSVDSSKRGTRIVLSPDEPDICYFLFLLPRKDDERDENYRERRRKMLYDYCAITKADYPQLSHIIGVAHESSDCIYSSEDFIYFDASEWSPQDQEEAVILKKEYEKAHLLAKRRLSSKTYFYEKPKMKGHDRNKPCPCGSGRKYKRCCGRG